MIYQEKLNGIIERAKAQEIKLWITYKILKNHEKTIFSIEPSDKWNGIEGALLTISRDIL